MLSKDAFKNVACVALTEEGLRDFAIVKLDNLIDDLSSSGSRAYKHVHTFYLNEEIKIIFKRFLMNVLWDNRSPWEIALNYQDVYWNTLSGRVIEVLRLKLRSIGYDPKIWLEAGKENIAP
ncbi:hypothetical protein YUBABA_00220 [Serratia phage vB_SmaM-Yubaba]|nr:hypothetical protein YUBABA_00220 [Serratia phage vB_SmaM-Yubaba]